MPRAIACPTWRRSSANPSASHSVRLTALRTGQVQLINTMAQADIERFKETQGDKYNLWEWHGGGQFVVFNFRRGPFQDKRLRIAAAHAIDRQAIHHAVYYGQGAMADQPYPEGNPWHLEGIRSLAVRSRQGQSPAQGGAGRRHRGQDPL